MKMGGESEKQIYKPLEVFMWLASLFDLYGFAMKGGSSFLDLDPGQNVIVT